MDKTAKQGVFTKTLVDGTVTFIIKYSINNKQFKKVLGAEVDGWTVAKASREREKLRNTKAPAPKRLRRTTLTMATDAYLESISYKPDTRNSKGRFNNHIKEDLGDMILTDITVEMVEVLKYRLCAH